MHYKIHQYITLFIFSSEFCSALFLYIYQNTHLPTKYLIMFRCTNKKPKFYYPQISIHPVYYNVFVFKVENEIECGALDFFLNMFFY